MYFIEMRSQEYGGELFDYSTREEMVTGLERLTKEVETRKDGIAREFLVFTDNQMADHAPGESKCVCAGCGQEHYSAEEQL